MKTWRILITNNLTILFLHAVIAALLLVIGFFCFKQSSGSLWEWLWALGGLSLYIPAGYLLTGNLLRKLPAPGLNFLSLASLLLIGAGLWVYCATYTHGLLPGLVWINYFILFPFSGPFYQDNLILLTFALLPTLLVWIGMQLRRKKAV